MLINLRDSKETEEGERERETEREREREKEVQTIMPGLLFLLLPPLCLLMCFG